jgi:hypothetical protein
MGTGMSMEILRSMNYCVLSTNDLMDRMQIVVAHHDHDDAPAPPSDGSSGDGNGNKGGERSQPRLALQHATAAWPGYNPRWVELIDLAGHVLDEMATIAAVRRRNILWDQTNV